jgi:hypothetical protein
MAVALLVAMCGSALGISCDYYVKTGGSDSSNGTTWNTAFKTIQKGIDTASAGDDICVEEGTYTLTAQTNVNKAVGIYGGYDDSTHDRDSVNNVTTVDGNESVRCFYVTANATIDGFTISDGDAGGAYGGGMKILSCTPTIEECVFTNNEAYDGGGMYNSETCSTAVTNCIFSDNSASRNGGAMCNASHAGDCLPEVTSSLFYGNTAGNSGGAIANRKSSPTLINCTLAANEAEHGGGIGNHWSESTPTLVNCIFWGNDANSSNEPNEVYNVSGDPNFSYCDVRECGGSSWDPNCGTDGGHNIDQDPCFVNPDSNDLHLKPSSLCIDAGDCNRDYTGQTDMDGEPRVMRECVDIGADEVPGVHNIDKDKWYVTIQEAINDAAASNEIVVYQGTYSENVDFGGRAITVRSTDPNDSTVVAATIIDGGGSGNVVEFDSSETSTSVLEGLTIADGNRGIYCYYSSPTISKCVITDNNTGGSDDGAGMYNDHSDPNVLSCTFTSNESDDEGGGIGNYYSDPCVVNCNFSANFADDDGGGIYNYSSSPKVTNCIFTENDASDGGGMANKNGSAPEVISCVFYKNETDGYSGGGIDNDSSSPQIINCLFYDNDADEVGGGIFNDDSEPNIINCTFYGNYANDYGGALANDDGSDCLVANCILWNNDAGDCGEEVYNDDSEPTFDHCCIRGDVDGTYFCGDNSEDDGGNIDDDPQFCDDTDGDGTDNVWATCDDGLNLQSDSPCVDTGTGCPAGTDLCGKTRCLNSTVDMGAYEMDPSDNCGT